MVLIIGIGSRESSPMSRPCPCCGFLTFYEEPCGTFEICPVCYWEDDNVQNEDPDYCGGANGISLNEAKKNVAKYGAVKKEFSDKVRKPFPYETPS
jgi:hypothetical protein